MDDNDQQDMNEGAGHRREGYPQPGAHEADRTMYWRLGSMLGVSLVWMYGAMFAMVDRFAHADMNLNFFYMALLMAAPMGVFEVAIMWPMYGARRVNIAVLAVAALITIASFLAIRTQLAVNDERFLESMIPHHSGAILMCEQASITDEQVQDLCDRIVESQRAEISEMEDILDRLDE
ncbi:MAG TPA: DUF305 domain-containing protein [Dehalococcoidia bacterium]|nr:DUF305 domain-containing protein [Dehalococcoidia bacterium]